MRQSETKINAELSDLDKSIILKEALLAQIKDGQASYETMQQVTLVTRQHTCSSLVFLVGGERLPCIHAARVKRDCWCSVR